MAQLTPQEQQEIIRYLEAGKPLPDKYRFLLFADKREVELVWNGKTSEVSNIVPPFQVIEQVDGQRLSPILSSAMTSFRAARSRDLCPVNRLGSTRTKGWGLE